MDVPSGPGGTSRTLDNNGAWQPNALNSHRTMLSTTANPTDGLRFDDDASHRRPIGSSQGFCCGF
jgi:hypothetical protein